MQINDPQENNNNIIFSPFETISSKQLSEKWNLFPVKVQKSLNKAIKGELIQITKSELEEQIKNYLIVCK